MLGQTVIFMDFDGVLNFFAPKNYYRQYGDTFSQLQHTEAYADGQNWKLNWSAELIQKLMMLKQKNNFEWHWLTTWAKDTNILDKILKIDSTLSVSWEPYPSMSLLRKKNISMNSYRNAAKLDIVLMFADAAKAPFIWIDDEATQLWTAEYSELIEVPHLIIQPSGTYGLVKHDVGKIEKFLLAVK